MEGFTVVDAVVAVVIVLSAILAFSRGFVREAFAIGGWIVAAVLAYMFAHSVRPMIAQIPVLDDFLGDSCELSTIAGFAVVFAGALIVMSIFTSLFASVVQRSALGGIDRGLGLVFGVLRGILLVAVAFVVYDRVMSDQNIAVVDDSRSAKVFSSMQASLDEQMPQDAPGWIVARYEDLVNGCTGDVTTVPATIPDAAPETAPAAPAN